MLPALIWEAFALGFVTLALQWILFRFLRSKAKKDSTEQHLRGAKLISEDQLIKEVKKRKLQTSLPFGPIPMPVQAECRHSLVLGSSGSGKTQLLSNLLDELLRRGERIILHDYKGDYLERFYHPDRDIIFNPDDQRSIGWSVFDAIETVLDVKTVAQTLIPPSQSKEPFFDDATRGLLEAILHLAVERGQATYKGLNELLLMERFQLAQAFALSQNPFVKAGAVQLQDAGTTTGSILKTLRNKTDFFLQLEDKANFQIGDWLANQRGIIFLANHQSVKDAMRPILTLFLDTVAHKLLSQADQPARNPDKTFFLLDELAQLGQLHSIESLLTLGRSKGAAVILATQDLAQLKSLYGEDARRTFANNCATQACFALASAEEAKAMSDAFGEQEVLLRQKSHSLGRHPSRDGIGFAQQRQVTKLVLPSEIAQLQPGEFFLKLPGFDLTKTSVAAKDRECLNAAFNLRPGLRLDSAKTSANSLGVGGTREGLRLLPKPMVTESYGSNLGDKNQNQQPDHDQGNPDLEIDQLKY